MLATQFQALLSDGWSPVFAQERSHQRAIEHALAWPCTLGRRTISRTLCALGRANQDWSADYKMFSRSRWEEDQLFTPVFADYLARYPEGPLTVAFDDTKTRKTGKKITTAFWQRDPLSPPFHRNLFYGLRFVQAALVFPHHSEGDFPPRGIPVRFREAPVVKKPGKRATEQQRQQYLAARKERNLSTQTLAVIRGLREHLDQQGAAHRPLRAALDGSFCNQTIFKAPLDRVELVARCRKDARLCYPAAPGARRKYDAAIFTPEQVRQDQNIPWKKTKIYFGGKRRKVRYKEANRILWKRGAGRRLLRLIVIAPTPYRLSKHSRTNYRQPAYLLSTDLHGMCKHLVQACFDRWQIEVNHRDEKSLLGVAQAQVHSQLAVPRHPAFVVAVYSLLLLAALREYGPGRTNDFLPLPKWRKNSKRPSLLDLLTLLRQQINETSVSSFAKLKVSENLLAYAFT